MPPYWAGFAEYMYRSYRDPRTEEGRKLLSERSPSGQIVMSVKFGARPIEFERGKAGIVVLSKDKLPAVIETLIAAVRAGELDELFSQATKAGSIGKPRKAA